MLDEVRADELDLDDQRPGPVADGEPGVASGGDGIHALHDDIEAEVELIGGELVSDDVPLVPPGQPGTALTAKDGALDRVDAEVCGPRLACRRTADSGLARRGQASDHDERRRPHEFFHTGMIFVGGAERSAPHRCRSEASAPDP